MDKFKNYDVVFSGIKNGKHEFQFEIKESFFELFDTEQDFTNPQIEAHILLEKHTTFLELWIKITGTVTLVCDITSEPFVHAIENEIRTLVKFGPHYDDSQEEVITIPESSHAFNVAQLVYENVVLAIPMKKISPMVSAEDLELLEKFSVQLPASNEEESPEATTEPIDPRWDVLKKLKDKN